jgi:repressor LexA
VAASSESFSLAKEMLNQAPYICMVTQKSRQKQSQRGLREERHELTPAQAKVFRFIRDSFFQSGAMPTLREICRKMDWRAVGSAQDVISALIEKGWLAKDPHKARGLSLPDLEMSRAIPLLGSAPAGAAIESIEAHEKDIMVPAFLRGPIFAVRVVGDSMIQAGIQSGDMVIVRQSADVPTGRIVVAMIEGEVTIKRLSIRSSEIWLVPENPRYQPRRVEDESFRILGEVIGLHRYWESI